MISPKVYRSIAAVARELARRGIGKSRTNAQEHYQFRSIDDVYNRLSPVLAKHKICILPKVLERSVVQRHGSDGALLLSVTLKIAYHIISADDGSSHVIEVFGEALDEGDKATSKAMSSAYKYALLQAFCIPVVGHQDADGTTHKVRRAQGVAEPVQGWEQWTRDVSSLIDGCESGEAVDRVQETYRAALRAVARARPELYCGIGETIARKRRDLATSRGEAASVASVEAGGTNQAGVAKAPSHDDVKLERVGHALLVSGASSASRKGNGADKPGRALGEGGHD
jgi:hypothetical protein